MYSIIQSNLIQPRQGLVSTFYEQQTWSERRRAHCTVACTTEKQTVLHAAQFATANPMYVCMYVCMYSETFLVCAIPQRGHKISTYYQRYVLSGLVHVHEVYTGTE